jgi:cytosine deaminase
MTYELLIRNGRLRGGGDLVDLAIERGHFAAIGADLGGDADLEIDVDGRLVTEPFVNGHLHLDKFYTLEMVGEEGLAAYTGGEMGGAMTAIELASAVKASYDRSWIVENVRRAVRLAIRYGTTHVRAFADTDTTAGLEGVSAVMQVRDELADAIELQVVAFPQDGVIRDPGAADLVREAVGRGADVVGGIPWIEYTDADAREHIDQMFAIALEYDRDVSMLVDDAADPGLRTLEMLAVKTIQTGWHGRVTAQHARAMALYPEPYFRKVLGLLKEARIGVLSDPQTGPLHARVRDLHDAGVAVALGQDDIADAYYPFGRNNMLEVAFLNAHLLWMTSSSDLELLYDLITTEGARALGIDDSRSRKATPPTSSSSTPPPSATR